MSDEITNKQIFEAIIGLKDDITVVKADITVLKGSVKNLEGSVKNLEETVDVANERIDGLATHMDKRFDEASTETKKFIAESEHKIMDHVDRRFAASVEEIVSPMRKIDTKDTALVEQLEEKSVITPKESARIVGLSPFPAL